MDQIAVPALDLDQVEAGPIGAPGGLDEGRLDFGHARLVQFARHN